MLPVKYKKFAYLIVSLILLFTFIEGVIFRWSLWQLYF